MKRKTLFPSFRHGQYTTSTIPAKPSVSALVKTCLLTVLMLIGASLTAGAYGEEKLEMDGMAVIGNQELPKALFIVPWKDPETAMAPDRPINTLLDEALQPVDPEVFRRKLQYYDIVHRKD